MLCSCSIRSFVLFGHNLLCAYINFALYTYLFHYLVSQLEHICRQRTNLQTVVSCIRDELKLFFSRKDGEKANVTQNIKLFGLG